MEFDIALICTSLVFIFVLVIGIVLFFKLARVGFKWLLTIILNSIVGIVCLFLLNVIGTSLHIQSLQAIPIWPTIVPVALFGLPGLATILLIMLLGVKISF
ncbi:pro-sigmaK processing inhibitor BofA family protein [Candidatus Micrarchaeota archaeon]|nr:pro-sigmaK processing inhibitor BofA family protein [Candidatus Micrarchaeota archaeon]